jgi:hypothetical protein
MSQTPLPNSVILIPMGALAGIVPFENRKKNLLDGRT